MHNDVLIKLKRCVYLFQDCLEDADNPELELGPIPHRRSQLLTDRDPILGEAQGLCDTAGTNTRHGTTVSWANI